MNIDFSDASSPLRWAGSKRALLPTFSHYLPRTFRTYVEPFAGSASLFFLLAPRRAILGDINADLISFFRTLACRPRSVADHAQRLARGPLTYYQIRDVNPADLAMAAAAGRFLYLNRRCFNGVYRTNRLGQFNVPEGKQTGEIPNLARLSRASKQLRCATLINADFEETIALARHGDFVYLDPPYARRRARRPGEYGYESFDGEVDIERLAAALDALNARGINYMISYANSQALLTRVQYTWKRTIKVMRNVGGYRATRRHAVEVLLGNYPLPTRSRA